MIDDMKAKRKAKQIVTATAPETSTTVMAALAAKRMLGMTIIETC